MLNLLRSNSVVRLTLLRRAKSGDDNEAADVEELDSSQSSVQYNGEPHTCPKCGSTTRDKVTPVTCASRSPSTNSFTGGSVANSNHDDHDRGSQESTNHTTAASGQPQGAPLTTATSIKPKKKQANEIASLQRSNPEHVQEVDFI